MPPLRELTDDIPNSSSLYLNILNVELSRQIVGFTPEALNVLTSYQWPDNFLQLKRVLTELATYSVRHGVSNHRKGKETVCACLFQRI